MATPDEAPFEPPISGFGADDLDSEYDEDEYERYQAEKPFKLKDEGNQKYGNGQYEAAIKFWMESVKETLKRSVRTPSPALYKNQITCRLNMAMGYLKLNEWVDAKEQAELVLEQRPTNVKALYRMALALEKIQDWTPCESVLQKLLVEAKRGEDEMARKKEGEEGEKNEGEKNEGLSVLDLEEAERVGLDLEGFAPDEICRLVNDVRKRIARDKAVYKQRAKKVFGGIGAKLDQIGASEDRTSSVDKEKKDDKEMLEDDGFDDLKVDAGVEDLIKKGVVKWKHLLPQVAQSDLIGKVEESEAGSKKETDKTSEVDGMKNEDTAAGNKEGDESKDTTECKKRNEQLLSPHATNVLKDGLDDNDLIADDPKSPLWATLNTAENLKADRRSMFLSLPFSILRCIELATAPPKSQTSADANSDATTGAASTESHQLLDKSKRGRLRRRLLRSVHRRRRLTLHVLGARGDVEMECQWTSVLKRIPELKTLQILFIGFQDPDDRWNRGLREGVTSPPLVKSKGLLAGQKLTCRLFKGLYQLFLQEYPDVLTRPSHPYHPDLVVVPEPRFARYFDSWIPVFSDLVNHEIPTLITGYSAVDHATHDAQNLPVILKSINAEWAVPLQPNPYAIKVQPEPDFPPMQLWAPPGEEEFPFHGVSAKNAVFGVIFGYSSDPYKLDNIEALKSELRPICDVDSEEVVVKEIAAEQAEKKQREAKEREGGTPTASDAALQSNKDTDPTPNTDPITTATVSVELKSSGGNVTTVEKEAKNLD